MGLEGLYVPVHASWSPTFRAELLSFPAGKHDDQVDALGLIGQLLDKMTACRPPHPDETAQRHRNPRTGSTQEKGRRRQR